MTQLGKVEASKKIKALEKERGCMKAMLTYSFLQGWKHLCILLFGQFCARRGERALQDWTIPHESSHGQVELPRGWAGMLRAALAAAGNPGTQPRGSIETCSCFILTLLNSKMAGILRCIIIRKKKEKILPLKKGKDSSYKNRKRLFNFFPSPKAKAGCWESGSCGAALGAPLLWVHWALGVNSVVGLLLLWKYLTKPPQSPSCSAGLSLHWSWIQAGAGTGSTNYGHIWTISVPSRKKYEGNSKGKASSCLKQFSWMSGQNNKRK